MFAPCVKLSHTEMYASSIGSHHGVPYASSTWKFTVCALLRAICLRQLSFLYIRRPCDFLIILFSGYYHVTLIWIFFSFYVFVVNPLTGTGNYSATSNNISWYTGRWSVGYYIWYSEEGLGGAAVQNAHPSSASVPSTVLL